MIGEGEKNTVVLSMISIDSCRIILYIVKENIFCRYCLYGFITKKFTASIKDCFKINGKQTIKTPKKGEYVKFKNLEKKKKKKKNHHS